MRVLVAIIWAINQAIHRHRMIAYYRADNGVDRIVGECPAFNPRWIERNNGRKAEPYKYGRGY